MLLNSLEAKFLLSTGSKSAEARFARAFVYTCNKVLLHRPRNFVAMGLAAFLSCRKKMRAKEAGAFYGKSHSA